MLPAPADMPQSRLRAAERGESSGAFAGDERIESGVDYRGFLLKSAQPSGFVEKRIVEVEGCSHMHQYARFMQLGQPVLQPGSMLGAATTRSRQAAGWSRLLQAIRTIQNLLQQDFNRFVGKAVGNPGHPSTAANLFHHDFDPAIRHCEPPAQETPMEAVPGQIFYRA